MDINTARSIFTVATFMAFVGIVMWAYSRSNRHHLEEAGKLPMDDELSVGQSKKVGGSNE